MAEVYSISKISRMICAYCGKEIEMFSKYYKHDKTGIIVHKKCLKKFIKRENKNEGS